MALLPKHMLGSTIQTNKKMLDSIPSSVLKELIATRQIYRYLKQKDLEGAKTALKASSITLKTPVYRQLLDRELKKLEALIASGMPDYVHINETAENEGEELLQQIINKHKGKVLYLDFWATWCNPCISSFDRVKPLKKQLENEDIVFVYLCGANSNELTYKNILKAKDVKGEHYFLNENQWRSVWEKFNVTGIPHFALINKKGQVQDSNAPSPTNENVLLLKLRNLIEQ